MCPILMAVLHSFQLKHTPYKLTKFNLIFGRPDAWIQNFPYLHFLFHVNFLPLNIWKCTHFYYWPQEHASKTFVSPAYRCIDTMSFLRDWNTIDTYLIISNAFLSIRKLTRPLLCCDFSHFNSLPVYVCNIMTTLCTWIP